MGWIPESEEVEVEISAIQCGVPTTAVVKRRVWNRCQGQGVVSAPPMARGQTLPSLGHQANAPEPSSHGLGCCGKGDCMFLDCMPCALHPESIRPLGWGIPGYGPAIM